MTFPYQGRDIPYTLTRRRNMKTMRAKVMADGTIAVSAAPRVPTAEIVRFLTANAASLLEMQARALARRAAAPTFADGSTVRYLGGDLTLRWHPTPCAAEREGDVLTVFARTPDEARLAWEQWQIRECVALYRQLNIEVYRHFHSAGYDVPLARIEIKDMVSRLGSCTAASGRVSMNIRLMAYPVETIRGVFYHEYSHFLHQDHSKAFYAVLRGLYPAYDRWDALLKK